MVGLKVAILTTVCGNRDSRLNQALAQRFDRMAASTASPWRAFHAGFRSVRYSSVAI
jgi:hypothetical protein